MTHPISEKKLDVAALLEGTTPGPWEMTTHGTGLGFGVMQAFDVGFMQVSSNHTAADAALIAAAPRLAAEHIALTKKVDELEAALREVQPFLDDFWCDGEDDDEPVGWTTDSNGADRKAMLLTFGMIRRFRTALNDTTQCRESDNG